ncbi:MAG TPA: ethanolamine ammonia-lyase subunit EutC [Segetibacter sp.]|jgi:ethanolamine ammonia-lyase small subunit
MRQVETVRKNEAHNIQQDSWRSLKAFTEARIALGRTGTSVPLDEYLAFKLAHANARDAVYSTIKVDQLCAGLQSLELPFILAKSKVRNRQEYLQRPDLGRQLNSASSLQLAKSSSESFDISIIVADGLSAAAINAHTIHLLQLLVPRLRSAGCTLAPIVVAENARVAISDEIGERLKAKIAVILIGERPGLSSNNSLGAYLTYSPKAGLTDESRNCVSNIRPEGLAYECASDKLFFLIKESLRRKLSGVRLKEEALRFLKATSGVSAIDER